MCNLSTGYFNEGRELGINEGMDSAIVDMIWHYAVKKGVTIKQSMEDHSIPENKWNYYSYKCEEKYGDLTC